MAETRVGHVWLWQALPTGLVLLALTGIAVGGHLTGWTMPRFSELTGNGAAPKNDWCEAHSVPESLCVECNPDLLPRGQTYEWCKTHGVHECPWCHPDLAELPTGNTPVSPDALERARRALSFAERPENNSKCKLHLRRIQFASREAVDKAGIDVVPVREDRIVEYVAASGEVTYDQTRVARLSARVPGMVGRVTKQVGERVRQGEVLALVDAVEVGRAKAEFLQAFVQVELRKRTLEGMERAGASVPGRSVLEAQTALSEARIRLLGAQQALSNLGLVVPMDELRTLSEEKLAEKLRLLGLPAELAGDPRVITANLIPLTAPLDGVVVACEAKAGEMVDMPKVLFIVADISRMWLNLDIRLEDAGAVALGQTVLFRPDGGKGDARGSITWISTAVDEKTRTLKARVNLDNSGGRLRANTFGSGRIVLREEPRAVLVPSDAVQWDGDCHIVFVRDKDYFKAGPHQIFHVRTVRMGARDGQNTEIIAGLLSGEVVATKGSGMLRGELLKNNLGEGCGCCH